MIRAVIPARTAAAGWRVKFFGLAGAGDAVDLESIREPARDYSK
jgi:hypothetical protein